MIPALFAGPRDDVGERLARFVVSLLENPDARRRLTGLIRAAATEPEAARMVRDLISHEVIGRIVIALDVDDGDLRASLVGSQVVGLVMARYVVGVEPLASLEPEALIAAIAPNLQRYLVGPIR